jgi:hypothetical protein
MIRWREWSLGWDLCGHAQYLLQGLWETCCCLRISVSDSDEKKGAFDPTVFVVLLLLMCTIAYLISPDTNSDYNEAFVWQHTILYISTQRFIYFASFHFILKVSKFKSNNISNWWFTIVAPVRIRMWIDIYRITDQK